MTARTLLLVFTLAATPWLVAGTVTPVERYALIAGSDSGGAGTATLRYASSDASRFMDVMTRWGGLRPENSQILLNPEKDAMVQTLAFLKNKVAKGRAAGRTTQFIFYYSGHSDERGLMLGGEHLDYTELRTRINALQSDVQVVILDSCSSGTFTRLKGGTISAPFLEDLSTSVEGHAYLTSSTAGEASQESDRLRSSFFTYALIEGLRGAADANGDGTVSLGEVYDYAYAQTLTDTQKTASGGQHPAFEIQLNGKGNLVMTDVRDSTASLVLAKGLSGRLVIRDVAGHVVAEVQKPADRALTIAVSEGYYKLTLAEGGRVVEASKLVDESQPFTVTSDDFLSAKVEATRTRGSTEGNDSTDLTLLGVRRQFDGADVLSLNLLMGVSRRLSGISVSPLANIAVDTSGGLQVAAGFNWADSHFSGFQGVSVFNSVRGTLDGVQIGLVNSTYQAKMLVQAGYLNLGGSNGTGVQFGIINYADRMTGVQLGLINIAQHLDGLPLGLLDLQFNGQNHVEALASFDPFGMGMKDPPTEVTVQLRLGSEYLYKFLTATTSPQPGLGAQGDYQSAFALGAGMGLRLPLGREFALRADVGTRFTFDGFVRSDGVFDLTKAPRGTDRNFGWASLFVPHLRLFADLGPAVIGIDAPVYTANFHNEVTAFSKSNKVSVATPAGVLFMGARLIIGLSL